MTGESQPVNCCADLTHRVLVLLDTSNCQDKLTPMDTCTDITDTAARNRDDTALQADAVVFEAPGRLSLRSVSLTPPGPADAVVNVLWSGISSGTERLLWTGEMPMFPGMGYPLVPGYESVGTVDWAGPESGLQPGQRVFVPGARCHRNVRGLFGGASRRLVAPGARLRPVPEALDEQAILLALAATAWHALGESVPDLIVGHGVLGRLLARLACLRAHQPPTVWERNPVRQDAADGYCVIDPSEDPRRDYRCIVDVSGDVDVLDELVSRLAVRGELVLAGFYSEPIRFAFPPAFQRELRMRVAAEWQPQDLDAVVDLTTQGVLSLDRLITHRRHAREAEAAYQTAFADPTCLKMLLDWRNPA